MKSDEMLSGPIVPIGEASWFSTDYRFHSLYPPFLRPLSKNHCTPLNVVRKAAMFLAEKNARILDIGSGLGKFCLAAAYYCPQAYYVGVEQRRDLTEYAEAARRTLGLKNVSFIHGNITDLDFSQYDHFYFYNSFYENIAPMGKIDEKIPYSVERYNHYQYFMYRQLAKKPSGTRVATYYGRDDQMPRGYHVGGGELNDLLKYWVKE